MKYPFVHAYGQMIGARVSTIQKMVQRATASNQPDEDLCWMIEGEGWKSLDSLSSILQEELQNSVREREGRSDDFILLRDMFGADEVEQDYLEADEGSASTTWQQRLCREYGWDDPVSIEWAARAYVGNDVETASRTMIVLQQSMPDGDSTVSTYIMSDDGKTWTMSAPRPGQVQEI